LLDSDDVAAHALGDLPKLSFLIGGGLIEGRNPQVHDGAAHESLPENAPIIPRSRTEIEEMRQGFLYGVSA
jgi:hypothetical protein